MKNRLPAAALIVLGVAIKAIPGIDPGTTLIPRGFSETSRGSGAASRLVAEQRFATLPDLFISKLEVGYLASSVVIRQVTLKAPKPGYGRG